MTINKLLTASVCSLALLFSGSAAAYADTGNSALPPQESAQQAIVQHTSSADNLRSIDAVGFEGGAAVSKINIIDGDTLSLSTDKKTVTWTSKSGDLVAVLDATSGGTTPLNSFELSGNTIKVFGIAQRSACGKSYAGAATFGVAWELGVCTPLGVAFVPAGIACGVGTALVSPLIPWDNVC